MIFCEDVNRFSVGVATDESICVEEMNSFFLSIFFLQLGSPPPPFFVLMDQFPKKVSKYIIEYKVLQNKIATCFQTLLAFIESG